uniref:Uncharacterized protein n=1 Tax=Anguilla anguilla TaxID=7936 RepID=A0A0E9TFF4_ANGAN
MFVLHHEITPNLKNRSIGLFYPQIYARPF